MTFAGDAPFSAFFLNRWRCCDEGEKVALGVFSLLLSSEIYAERSAERIECMKIVCYSLFEQGRTLVAERTVRKAVQMIVELVGGTISLGP